MAVTICGPWPEFVDAQHDMLAGKYYFVVKYKNLRSLVKCDDMINRTVIIGGLYAEFQLLREKYEALATVTTRLKA